MSTGSILSILAYPQYGYHLVCHTGLSLVHCSYLSVGSLQEVDEIRKKADELGTAEEATVLLYQAIDVAEKAQTQSILDQATIKQLQAIQPSKPDHRQIKGGLLLHTKVLGQLYKKCETDDRKKQARVEAGRIRRANNKRQQAPKKRIKAGNQKLVSPVMSESSESESTAEEDEQVVSIFGQYVWYFENLCSQ